MCKCTLVCVWQAKEVAVFSKRWLWDEVGGKGYYKYTNQLLPRFQLLLEPLTIE